MTAEVVQGPMLSAICAHTPPFIFTRKNVRPCLFHGGLSTQANRQIEHLGENKISSSAVWELDVVGAAMIGVMMGVVCSPFLFRKIVRDLVLASFFNQYRLKLYTLMKETAVCLCG